MRCSGSAAKQQQLLATVTRAKPAPESRRYSSLPRRPNRNRRNKLDIGQISEHVVSGRARGRDVAQHIDEPRTQLSMAVMRSSRKFKRARRMSVRRLEATGRSASRRNRIS